MKKETSVYVLMLFLMLTKENIISIQVVSPN